MKAIFFDCDERNQTILKTLLAGVNIDINFEIEPFCDENAYLAKDAEILSITTRSECNENHFKALPKLKFIAARSTGFDHIDTTSAKAAEITVSNVPSYGSRTVAEFTFALILNLSRKVAEANRHLRENSDFDISKLQGFDLQNKTLGIVGTGKIGKEVAKIARGFEMKILAWDKFPDEKFAGELNIEYTSLDELLKNSDIVSLHVPSTKDTQHLINADNISKFKNGSFLINTARGEVIETSALLSALKNGQLAGAALDVLEGERQLKEEIEVGGNRDARTQDFKTLFADYILIDMPNVIVTPHIAFDTKEAAQRILETVAENIKNFLKGTPNNLVK